MVARPRRRVVCRGRPIGDVPPGRQRQSALPVVSRAHRRRAGAPDRRQGAQRRAGVVQQRRPHRLPLDAPRRPRSRPVGDEPVRQNHRSPARAAAGHVGSGRLVAGRSLRARDGDGHARGDAAVADRRPVRRRRHRSTPAGQVAYGGGFYSRDGKRVYITTDAEGEFRRLARIDLATGAITTLSRRINWDVEDVALSSERPLARVHRERSRRRHAVHATTRAAAR